MANPINTSRLRFFDKNGDALASVLYDAETQTWTGSIFLPPVSVNLFETQTIYIMEECEDSFSNQNYLTFPKSLSSDPTQHGLLAYIASDYPEFSFYEVDYSDANAPILQNMREKSAILDYSSGDIWYAPRSIVQSSNKNNNAFRVDIAFRAKEDGNFEEEVVIEINDNVVARFSLYCEAIAEDDRVVTHLRNFGHALMAEDEFIFRQSDIEESMPDYSLLNAKRKEFMLAFPEIERYNVTYYGVYQILYLFGYYDLRIKELWLDSTNQKPFYVDLDKGEKLINSSLFTGGSIDENRHLHKTSFFGLFYDINVETGRLNNVTGLPEIQRNFMYSDQEIVLKLFGLKNWLKMYDIGGVSRCLDIIGELTHFVKLKIRHWDDVHTTIYYDQQTEVTFEAENTRIFIEDLRPYFEDWTQCELDPTDDPNVQTNTALNKCFIGWFSNHYQEHPDYYDMPDIPIGAVLKLTNTSFGVTWNDISLSWNDVADANLTITWDNFSSLNFYKAEWNVKRNVGIEDERQYDKTIAGTPSSPDILNPIFYLPYEGDYNVRLTLHSFNGGKVTLMKKNFINVRPKQADFMCFFKILNPNLQKWDTCHLPWDKIMSEWSAPVYDNEQFSVYQDTIRNRSFSMYNYLDNLESEDIQRKYNMPTWAQMRYLRWQDMQYMTWNDMKYEPEKPATFLIDKIGAGTWITIGTDHIQIPADFGKRDLGRLCAMMNSLPESEYPDAVKFKWQLRQVGKWKYAEAIVGADAQVDKMKISTGTDISSWIHITGQESPSLTAFQDAQAQMHSIYSLDREWGQIFLLTTNGTRAQNHMDAELKIYRLSNMALGGEDNDINNNANFIEYTPPKTELITFEQIEAWEQANKMSYDGTQNITYSWIEGDALWCSAHTIGNAHTQSEPFGWDNIRMFKERCVSIIGVPVFFNYDMSGMAGKSTAVWTIKKKEGAQDKVVYQTEIGYFAYRFDQIGDYTVNVRIIDNKGNSSTIEKANAIKVIRAHQYSVADELGWEV